MRVRNHHTYLNALKEALSNFKELKKSSLVHCLEGTPIILTKCGQSMIMIQGHYYEDENLHIVRLIEQISEKSRSFAMRVSEIINMSEKQILPLMRERTIQSIQSLIMSLKITQSLGFNCVKLNKHQHDVENNNYIIVCLISCNQVHISTQGDVDDMRSDTRILRFEGEDELVHHIVSYEKDHMTLERLPYINQRLKQMMVTI